MSLVYLRGVDLLHEVIVFMQYRCLKTMVLYTDSHRLKKKKTNNKKPLKVVQKLTHFGALTLAYCIWISGNKEELFKNIILGKTNSL